MLKRRIITVFFVCLAAFADLSAADAEGWFSHVQYGQPLYADEHPDFFRFDVATVSNNPVYDYGGDGASYRVQTLGVFGVRLPIWNGNLCDGQFGISVTQSMSANIWMDLFEPVTSPIINTDYRISAPAVTFIHRPASELSERRFFRNYSVRFAPFNHESTHIGDEMVLQRADRGYALRRVNVSYNYAELDLTLNEPEDRLAMSHTFRLGLMLLLSPKSGWYFVEERDGAVNNIPSDQGPHPSASNTTVRQGPSGLPFEMFMQYQFQSPTSKHGFQGIASAEIRNRALYGYDLTATTVSSDPLYSKADAHRFTYNVFIGARYNMPRYDGLFSRVSLGIRAYHGICPYGMFRSLAGFSHIGVCLIYQ